MELLNKFFLYVIEIFEKGILGVSFLDIILILSSFFLAILIRSVFAAFLIQKIKKVVKKTGNKFDDKIFDSLKSPLKFLPIIFVFIFLSAYVKTETNLGVYFDKINKTMVTIFIFWFVHQAISPLSHFFSRLEEIFSKALVVWLIKSLKYLILFLGAVAVLETWGIKIGPIIAGLGLFGVAVALGAQDLFKNLISGILIIFEKRFKINDTIEIPQYTMGVVEHIGFRSTLIRQFDSTPISIPNYVFSESSIVNFTQRKYRRINWQIGLTYETTTKQLKDICNDIEKFIISSNNFIINDSYNLFVRIEKFNDSSIDCLVYAFTNTNQWDEYLRIKESLVFEIKAIVEKHKCSFAYPSHSIYIEKK